MIRTRPAPWLHCFLLLAPAIACQPEQRPAALAAAAEAPQVQPLRQPCPGGLLCEAEEALLGWRVPARCEERLVRPLLATCVLQEVQWVRLVEFFRSRYGGVDERFGGLSVVGPSPGPGRTPPLLRAMRRDHRIEVLVLPGDATSVVSVPQDPGSKPGSVP